MSISWDPAHLAFLRDHDLGVLATGRSDGSPQQSMVLYVVDDETRLIVSSKSYTAKWHNAVRRPEVALTVVDGRVNLVIYGVAETIEADPLRAELSALAFAAMSGNEVDPASIIPVLDEQQRTVIRITPSRVLFHE
jgi:PPOX class probable F420-dependent enzyme